MNFLKIYILIVLSVGFISSCHSSNSGESEELFKLIWAYEYSGDPEGLSLGQLAPEPIGEDYIIISPDRFYSCLNQRTGELIWEKPLPDNAWVGKDKLLHDDSILYSKVHKHNKLQALDLGNGTLLWQQTNTLGVFFDYVNDGLSENQLYLAGDDSVIYQYSKSGEYQRELKLQHYARSILYNNGTLYVSQAWRPDGSEHAAGRIVAYDSETFEKKWEYETDKGGFYYAPMIYQNGQIYAGTTSGPSVFVTLDAITGEIIWERDDQVAYDFVMKNDTIFINNSLEIVALDVSTGEKFWQSDFGVGDATDNIAYLNGYLYHSHGTALYILDAATGEIVHKEAAPPDGTFFVNVAAANGRVFAMSNYHLYAYEAWK